MACIPDGVLPNGAIVAYGRGELGDGLSDVGVRGCVGCEYGLLEILEAFKLCVGTSYALLKVLFGKRGSRAIHLPP